VYPPNAVQLTQPTTQGNIASGAAMKRKTLGRASLVFTALAALAACGSKQDAQQPQAYQPGQPGAPGYAQPGQPGYPAQPGYPQPGDPNYGQPASAPYGTAPQPGTAYPPPAGQPGAAPAPGTPGAAPAPSADAATTAAVRLALQPRAASEAKGMKEDGEAIGGMLQEGGTLTQEFNLMPGRCYTILGQGLPPVAELDLQLAAKPLVPTLPPAILAADNTSGPAANIGAGKNCYKNPFPVAAPVILTLKATKGSGPAGAQVYSK
jgi:hypothetical protein